MIFKLNSIILFSVFTFLLSLVVYPLYIRFLVWIKAWKTIRDDDVMGQKASIFQSLHSHKSGTPTMGGGLFLFVVLFMIWISFLLQHFDIINNNLFSREETYLPLFGFFSMGLVGLIDDILNIKGVGRVKGLSALSKTIGMVLFAAFISYRFYYKLHVDRILLWPGIDKVFLWLWFFPLSFFSTLFITHAINITDGLDGLAWWMMTIVLSTLWVVTFVSGQYISTTLIGVVIAVLVAFLRFNINPARLFMGDSGAFSLWWLLSCLFWLNIKIGIVIPFLVVFLIFIIELLSDRKSVV